MVSWCPRKEGREYETQITQNSKKHPPVLHNPAHRDAHPLPPPPSTMPAKHTGSMSKATALKAKLNTPTSTATKKGIIGKAVELFGTSSAQMAKTKDYTDESSGEEEKDAEEEEEDDLVSSKGTPEPTPEPAETRRTKPKTVRHPRTCSTPRDPPFKTVSNPCFFPNPLARAPFSRGDR